MLASLTLQESSRPSASVKDTEVSSLVDLAATGFLPSPVFKQLLLDYSVPTMKASQSSETLSFYIGSVPLEDPD